MVKMRLPRGHVVEQPCVAIVVIVVIVIFGDCECSPSLPCPFRCSSAMLWLPKKVSIYLHSGCYLGK